MKPIGARLLVALLFLVSLSLVVDSGCKKEESAGQKWEREHNFSDPGDDPRMKTAEAESRRRWPEFVTAFNERKPNRAYAVKARFVDGKVTEWMWMQVESINGNTVTGRVDNDPVDVKNVKLGDRVSKPLADIDDWIVGDGKTMTGGFTSKVLQQIESERKK